MPRRLMRALRPPRLLRRLLPRSFQGRLALSFVGVIALTLVLVTVLVINRLDDYFTRQQTTDLLQRAETVSTYVQSRAREAAEGAAVVGLDRRVNPAVLQALDQEQQRVIADRLGQADVQVRFGLLVATGEGFAFVPALDDPLLMRLEAQPAPGQTQERSAVVSKAFPAGSLFKEYAVEVTLSNPYTFRATALGNVTGLLAAIALFALGLSVVVSAAMARRFTTPLRRLTETSRGLAEGDLGRRVPPSQVRAGSSELAELAVQFNAMADRLEESVEIIRRDRDRSRDFLADVSHELRTPLAALRTFNELLREGADADPAARVEFLESSGQQIERLDWLAQNLLELSKLDSGLVLLDLRPDDLRAAVESAVEQSASAARKRGVTLDLRLPSGPVRIRHDPQRIGQVVANLVANAVKFTGRGGSVSVDVNATPDGAQIDVVDTGVGIDAAELPHIFERFYRGSRANEARGSGSGLGLAIVRSIVEMHGGGIVVESRVGAGSRFTVSLPRDPRLIEGSPAAERADVASAAAATAAAATATAATDARVPEPGPADLANMQETSPTERSQVNTEAAR
ncbi:MAG TPA: HAMP domain-containing sensor histidine kinase [Candidatus Limnocylindrales bacterium]|nr:HAMP domain-containing sensor histidine kinase [Candidatus Limnocylindrales bacterium]